MYVECTDENTLVFENSEDLEMLQALSAKQQVPEYLESAILKMVLPNCTTDNCSIEELIALFPKRRRDLLERIEALTVSIKDLNDSVNYDGNEEAYLFRYLMINLFKVWKPLTDLLVVNKLFANPKILDLGSGPGSCTIGILLFYNALAKYNPDINFHLELTLLDRSEVFLKYAKELISIVNNHLEKNLTIRSTDISLCDINADTIFSQYGTKDLIVCSNFFPCNEADGNDANALSIANNLEEILDSNGSYIIIEPGDKNNSIGLNTIGNNIKKAGIWNEFSPCANIWENTDTNCCCFNCFRLHWIRPQSFSLFTYKETFLQHLNYSYKIFRLDGKRKYDFLCNYRDTSCIRLSELNNNLNKKVNIICFIRTIINNENNKIKWLLCDGTNPTQDLKLSQDGSKIKFLGEILGGELVQIKNCIIEKEIPYQNRYIIKNVNDADVKILY